MKAESVAIDHLNKKTYQDDYFYFVSDICLLENQNWFNFSEKNCIKHFHCHPNEKLANCP